MKPIIAITAKTEELRSRPQITLPDAYVKAIEDAGGVPVILPIINHKRNISEIAKFADGFLFSGGDDIHPRYYDEKLLLPLELSPDARTDFEIALFNEALQLRKPILGICLGAQLMNVALGGSLYQDIPTQIHESLNHRAQHSVSIKEGTLLHRILSKAFISQRNTKINRNLHVGTRVNVGTDLKVCPKGMEQDKPEGLSLHLSEGYSNEILVTSAHHQAVKSPGKGLIISATSDDGVVEAIEMPDYPFLIGVQWHPERSSDDEYTRRLFNAFVDSARNSNRNE